LPFSRPLFDVFAVRFGVQQTYHRSASQSSFVAGRRWICVRSTHARSPRLDRQTDRPTYLTGWGGTEMDSQPGPGVPLATRWTIHWYSMSYRDCDVTMAASGTVN